LGETRHGREVTDAQLAGFQKCGDQPHPTGIGQDTERLSEILKDAFAGEPLEDDSDPVRIDALDLATIERYHARTCRCSRYLHTHEAILSHVEPVPVSSWSLTVATKAW
jgi:hypothetical protein